MVLIWVKKALFSPNTKQINSELGIKFIKGVLGLKAALTSIFSHLYATCMEFLSEDTLINFFLKKKKKNSPFNLLFYSK